MTIQDLEFYALGTEEAVLRLKAHSASLSLPINAQQVRANAEAAQELAKWLQLHCTVHTLNSIREHL